jgi:zinc/manganese transport system substrate-binding protein
MTLPETKKSSRAWLLVCIALVASTAGACSRQSSEPGAELRVVATTSILGDLASAIVGERGEVEVLMPVGTDPHDFQPSAQDLAAISTADLVVANGLGLETGLNDALAAAEEDGARVLSIGPRLDPLGFGGGKCDVESGGIPCDPHVWLDPIRMGRAAHLVAEQLVTIDGSVNWSAAAGIYEDQLEEADAEIEALLSSIPDDRRILVTNHDSLGYFAERYGLEVVGTVIPGGSTVADPSSEELADLVAVIRDTGTSAIFAETTDSTSLADAVAGEIGFEVEVVQLFTGSLGGPGSGAATLPEMLVKNAGLILGGLQ